ncbi:MAG: flavin reductase family protein [Candidatus Syntropharchaeia archaeon]
MELKPSDYPKLLVRQVVVITTISKEGIPNAAPFSFSSPISFDPPLFGFSCHPEHDTWRNVAETKQFVVNVVGKDFGELMHILEEKYPPEVNEIEKANLTESPSLKVTPPRIKEANAWMECDLEGFMHLGDHIWIIGKVLVAEVRDELWDNVIDVEKASSLCHIGGEFFACDVKRVKYKRAN